MAASVRTTLVREIERPPGFSTGWISGPWVKVQMVRAGVYQLDHADTSERLEGEAPCFVPPGCRHRLTVVGTVPVRTLWWSGEIRLHGAIDVHAGLSRPQILGNAHGQALVRALLAIATAEPEGGLAGEFAAQARLATLAAALVTAVDITSASAPASRLDPVFRHIDGNLQQPCDRAGLAALLGLTPSRFHALFLAATGMAPMAWVRQRRLARAAELLSGTRLGLAAIAQQTGFFDAYHLSRSFRAAYGQPPAAFRRQMAG